MSDRIAKRFAALRADGRKALIPYITAGDPHPRDTVGLMHALVRGGADVIELGVPFSDPMADGPTIQLACERALAHGTSLRQVLQIVAEFRRSDSETPVVLMGYMNPIEALGTQVFAAAAQTAGVDGVLIVDLPVEECEGAAAALQAQGLDRIFLLAPTSGDIRIDAIVTRASGYLYYVSLKGVTGARTLDVADVASHVAAIRRHTGLPVAVGFGIRDAESARQVSRVADAVVVGSALVGLIEKYGDQPESLPERLRAALAELRVAVDSDLAAAP